MVSNAIANWTGGAKKGKKAGTSGKGKSKKRG
jgi:hypothetical protein